MNTEESYIRHKIKHNEERFLSTLRWILFSFIVGLVLARLLSPEEYGLIGIVMIFVTVLGGVVDSGSPQR